MWENVADYGSKVFVAQAEYYFDAKWKSDDTVDPPLEEWHWIADWRARLRRFRLPSRDDDSGSSVGGDSEGGDSGDSQGCEFEAPSLDPESACLNARGGGAQSSEEEGSGGASGDQSGAGGGCPGSGFFSSLEGVVDTLIVH